MVKTGHWKKFREGRTGRKEAATPLIGMSQKTYGNWILRILRVMGCAFVAEKRLRHPNWVPQYFIFRR